MFKRKLTLHNGSAPQLTECFLLSHFEIVLFTLSHSCLSLGFFFPLCSYFVPIFVPLWSSTCFHSSHLVPTLFPTLFVLTLLPLCSCRALRFLFPLCSHFVPILVPLWGSCSRFVPTLFPLPILVPLWCSSHFVPTLFPFLSHFVPPMFPLCSHFVPTLCPILSHFGVLVSHFVPILVLLWSFCSHFVPTWFPFLSHCGVLVLTLFPFLLASCFHSVPILVSTLFLLCFHSCPTLGFLFPFCHSPARELMWLRGQFQKLMIC